MLLANMPTIVTDGSFTALPPYPNIAIAYAYPLKVMKNLSFDIWSTSHASQRNMHNKHHPGDAYNPLAFKDQYMYDDAINNL